MPELPEVETIARELQPRLTGRRVESLRVLWPRTLDGDAGRIKAVLRDRTVTAVFRRGKYLCLVLDHTLCLTIHLRMSGRLLFDPGEESPRHLRACFRLSGGHRLAFVDPRKFGRIHLWPAQEPFLPKLGPEPLSPETVRTVLEHLETRRPIKAVLLDQRVLAGIGNIYADEALFAARLHPLAPAGALTPRQQRRLAAAVPAVLHAAIRARGTTLSDFRDPDQRSGEFQHQLRVFRRTGQPCPVCATPVARIIVTQRSTHFCPACQKSPPGKLRS